MKERNHYPKIEVFITKNVKFRAKIKERKDGIPYEVTIGGENWKNGTGREYQSVIQTKCENMVDDLNYKLKNIFDGS